MNKPSKNNEALHKLLQFLSAIIFIYCLVASYAGWPPASFVIEKHCDFFGTDNYSPVLIGAAMAICCQLPIIFIRKQIENK